MSVLSRGITRSTADKSSGNEKQFAPPPIATKINTVYSLSMRMANPALDFLIHHVLTPAMTTLHVFCLTQTIKSELAYALRHAERAPSNESPWNYLRGFFIDGGRSYSDFPEVKERVLLLQVCGSATCAGEGCEAQTLFCCAGLNRQHCQP